MANALSDLAALIGEGVEPNPALIQAAKPYSVKPDVLRARAAASGSFEDYVASVARAADVASRRRIVQQATLGHMDVGEQWWHLQDVRDELLRETIAESLKDPTDSELEWAKQVRAEYVANRQARNLAKLLNLSKSNRGERREDKVVIEPGANQPTSRLDSV